ncbi:TetR/AcrR family transcriptional regulator [Fusibacter paucivorans]|uniref:TetR/AcrR family transcriptional regulator n=1 Tax=Fusibacter paucivorans TaxID=76009 RepID=A0ABS5PM65_9FIRM|nr:TetR/AcrR family transcriptional regulator [Fusibacter paucivorans]MBS7526269.1 TetR/AcrR family transcriptional regulator [Fusibacter paucivorans]
MPKISEEKLKAKRDHIIACAFKVFSEKGYDATTMDDIVKLSGVSKGGIYHYFPSKEDVFFDIAEIQLAKRQALIAELASKSDFETFLKVYIKTVIKALDDETEVMNAKFSFEFWSIVTRAPKLQQYAQRRFAGFYKDLEQVFSDGVDGAKSLDVSAIGYVLIATIDGIIHTHAVMGIKASDAVIEYYTKAMINMVKNN